MTREERAYNFVEDALDNVDSNRLTRKMVRKSKSANKELKKGNFGKAELLRRKSEDIKYRALDRAKYNKGKMINIHLKAQDGDEIRHENKVRSISKLS